MSPTKPLSDGDANGLPSFTRRRFLGATGVLGGGICLPPMARAMAAAAPDGPVEEVARFLLRHALALSPPVVVALAHDGGPSWERFAELRAQATAQVRARGLLIHRTIDVGTSTAAHQAMHVESQGGAIDGWHLRLPDAVSPSLLRSLGSALENAARMARQVVWVELPGPSPWLPVLAQAAVVQPWLRLVLIASPGIFFGGQGTLDRGAESLLRQPNVLILFESRHLLSPAGRRVLEAAGSARMLWGVGGLAASALTLEPLTLAARLGRRSCAAVLSHGAVEAYGLQPHHYR